MKQVLAVRVGAKKAVGHIVSKRWWPTVRDTIVVLAGGRHCCIGLGGVGFAPSNEDLAFRDGVCHLMNLFLRTMFKLRQGPVQFLGLFLATEQEEFFLKRPRFWNHFGSFFWAGNSTR